MLKDWLRRKLCKHDWCLVWQRDYEQHVLGIKPSPFHNLSGEQTVYACNKCGATREGFFVKSEERAWTDNALISHFGGGA